MESHKNKSVKKSDHILLVIVRVFSLYYINNEKLFLSKFSGSNSNF